MTKKIQLLFIFLLLFSKGAHAQINESDAFYKTILEKDSLLFSVGFNTCDISQFENLLSDKLVFIHDKDGISNKQQFLNNLKNGLCKTPSVRQVKRVLQKESVTVYPLYKGGVLYGAVQNGSHLFYDPTGTTPGIAKFSNVWQLESGSWKLAVSSSYDHKPYSGGINPISLDNDAAVENWLKQNNVKTLGLGIIEGGKLKQIKVYGTLKDSVQAPFNTVFNVASLAKTVTTMVTLRLVSLGKWNLDEPVFHYWIDNDVKNDPRHKKLTTRMILSHQTGFPNWRYLNKSNTLSFEFEPGTKYQYSGEGFEYLRKALEAKFKKSLEQLAKELIFQPMGMHDTSYLWNEKAYESRFATGYNGDAKPYINAKNKTANAADDLHTTIADYGIFLTSVLNGNNLSEEVYREMIKPQVKTKDNKYFGLGFELYDLGNNEYAISHGGCDSGTQCLTFLLPKTNSGIIMFTNSDVGYRLYNELLVYYLGAKGKKLIDIENGN